MAAEWSSLSERCFPHTASRFLPREWALIHSECPRLRRGALILINVCFVPLSHSLKVRAGEGLRGTEGRNALMSKVWSIFLFFYNVGAWTPRLRGVLHRACHFPMMQLGSLCFLSLWQIQPVNPTRASVSWGFVLTQLKNEDVHQCTIFHSQ